MKVTIEPQISPRDGKLTTHVDVDVTEIAITYLGTTFTVESRGADIVIRSAGVSGFALVPFASNLIAIKTVKR